MGTILFALAYLPSAQAAGQLDFTVSVPLGNVQWNDVIYANGQYVAVGGNETTAAITAYSADGENWQFGNLSGGSGLTAVAFASSFVDAWIAVGYGGTLMTSADGINWTMQSAGLSGQDHIFSVTCSPLFGRTPTCVFGGEGETGGPNDQTLLYLSGDGGVTWAQQVATPLANRISAAEDFRGTFVVAGDQDAVVQGRNNRGRWEWSTLSSGGPSTEHMGLTYGNGVWVAVGRNASTTGVGEIAIAEDQFGATWSRIAAVGTDELHAVAFGADRFVAVGRNGTAAQSLVDGSDWTPIATSVTSNLNGVAFGDGQVLAVGDNGIMARAPVEGPLQPVASAGIRSDGVIQPDLIEVANGSFVRYVVAEYDLASITGSIESAQLRFSVTGFNDPGTAGSTLRVESYVADGQITFDDFSPANPTLVTDFIIPSTIRQFETLNIDITPALVAASGPLMGLRFSLLQTTSLGMGYVTEDGVRDVPRIGLILSTNEPPTADAGPDQSVRAPATVQLAGSAFDDNTASANLIYQWSVQSSPAGSAVTFANTTQADTTVDIDLPGTYVLQLSATDEDGAESAPDTVTISSDNLAPTADAGADQMVVTGDTVNLDGSQSSDPEGDPLAFSWSLIKPDGSVAILSDPNSVTPSFVPDVPGNYEAMLTVSDALSPGAPDSVIIVASSPGDFAQVEIQAADAIMTSLDESQVTTEGNRNALSNFLMQSTVSVQEGDTTDAVDKLDKAIERTDGCVERGSPDGNGPGRDWITDCQAQSEVYEPIDSARNLLSQ
jgi:hypothetical protein